MLKQVQNRDVCVVYTIIILHHLNKHINTMLMPNSNKALNYIIHNTDLSL